MAPHVISIMDFFSDMPTEEQRAVLVQYFCEHPGSDIFVQRAIRELKRRIPAGEVFLEHTVDCCSEHLYVIWGAPDPIKAEEACEFQGRFLREWWIKHNDPDLRVGFSVSFI